MENITTEETK